MYCLHYLFAAIEELGVTDFLPLGFQKNLSASSFMDARIVVNAGQQPPLATWCLHYLCISTQKKRWDKS